ncbi:MAG: glycerophosphodiester phosphodiesterase [Candidatus Neomarinimicrobiota bacterium]
MFGLLLSGGFLYLLSYRYFWKSSGTTGEQGPGFEMVSHRGVTVNSPENTIESYLEAVDRGFRWIELDVLCTKDRALVCSHNYDLERETDSHGYIHHTMLKDVKNAYTGVSKRYSGGFRIPTLTEALDKVPDNIGLNIEIKFSSLFDFSGARAICRIKNLFTNRSIIISSFNPLVLLYVKLFFGRAQTGFLIETKKYLWVVNWIHPMYLHPRADIIDSEVLSLCNEKKMGILAWTVNNRYAIKWCFNNNVIGVITDRKRSTI